jgi:hypothetical protein
MLAARFTGSRDGEWMRAHASMIISTDVGGKTEQVTPTGISDIRNDILLYSIVETQSHEIAAQAFVNLHICTFRNHPSK